jgi:hypothetical protein
LQRVGSPKPWRNDPVRRQRDDQCAARLHRGERTHELAKRRLVNHDHAVVVADFAHAQETIGAEGGGIGFTGRGDRDAVRTATAQEVDAHPCGSIPYR